MRILYGTSRLALREQVLQEISDLTSAWPDRRAILIVPEQTKMDAETSYLARSGQSGLMMAEVLSFRRLAWRLMGEIGRQPRQTIDAVGQGMLIHRVLTANQADLHSFGHLADRPGFIRQAASVLGDLKRYNINPDQLCKAAEEAGEKALRDKSGDLAVLLRGYDQALAATGLCDAEDDLNRLGEMLGQLEAGPSAASPSADWPWPVSRLRWLRRTSIWVSGFGELRDFTPQEDAILQSLNRLCESMTLTVVCESLPFDRLAADNGADCFLPGRKTALRLLQTYPGCITELLPDPTAGMAGSIAACFRDSKDCPSNETDDEKKWLQLVRAPDIDEELAWVAGEIRRLIQEDGLRCRDITIAACDLAAYAPRLRAVARDYDLPLFLDTGHALTGTPVMRFVLGLLDLGIYNWPQSTIMACLRSGLTPLSPDNADLLENELLAGGISRPDRLFDDSRYRDAAVLASRDIAFVPWRDMLNRIKSAATGAARCRALYEGLVGYGLPDRLGRRADQLAARGEMDAAVMQTQAWNELLRVLRQMAALAGDTPMTLQTFRDLLASGLEAAGTNVIPTAVDQIMVGDLKRAMLREARVLFLIGASADSLPPRLPPEGLLKDQDRAVLSGLIGRQLPSSARDQVFADAFVMHALLTLPREQLVVTSSTDAVSSLFTWLAESTDEHNPVLVLPIRPTSADARLNALNPAFRHLISKSSQGPLPSNSPDLPGWLAAGISLKNAGLPLAEAERWLRQAARPGLPLEIRVLPDHVLALYSSHPTMSVSQLERYAACPFQHFASNLLQLREREVWSPDAADAGTLLHGIVELALAELRDLLEPLAADDQDGRQSILSRWLADGGAAARVSSWMRTAAERDKLLMFFDKGIQASSGRRVRRLAASSLDAINRQYQKDDYRPLCLEWTFGPNEPNQLSMQLDDGTFVAFRGKIDRVDHRQAEDMDCFRIVDYKSGGKRADFEAFYYGLALQLPAYLEAFARCNPGCLAEDAAYFQFAWPLLSRQAGERETDEQILADLQKSHALRGLKLSPEEVALLRRHTLRKARQMTGQLLAGNFEAAPRKVSGKPLPCTYCVLQAVCGFDGSLSACRWLTGLQSSRKSEILRQMADEDKKAGEGHDAAHT